MEKFESEVKYISYPLEVVYGKMADLRNLSVLKERFADPNFQQAAMNASGGKVSESQFQSISEKLQNMQFDEDSVSLDINPVGNITLQIIERELNKTLKFETVNSPVAEKPLREAVEKIADMLTMIPYGNNLNA